MRSWWALHHLSREARRCSRRPVCGTHVSPAVTKRTLAGPILAPRERHRPRRGRPPTPTAVPLDAGHTMPSHPGRRDGRMSRCPCRSGVHHGRRSDGPGGRQRSVRARPALYRARCAGRPYRLHRYTPGRPPVHYAPRGVPRSAIPRACARPTPAPQAGSQRPVRRRSTLPPAVSTPQHAGATAPAGSSASISIVEPAPASSVVQQLSIWRGRPPAGTGAPGGPAPAAAISLPAPPPTTRRRRPPACAMVPEAAPPPTTRRAHPPARPPAAPHPAPPPTTHRAHPTPPPRRHPPRPPPTRPTPHPASRTQPWPAPFTPPAAPRSAGCGGRGLRARRSRGVRPRPSQRRRRRRSGTPPGCAWRSG